MRTVLLLCVSLAWWPVIVCADVAADVNQVRLHGCAGSPRGVGRLRENARLGAAARRLARGETLSAATAAAGYRALNSASVQIMNVPDERDVQRILAQQFCARVTDPGLRDIGTYRQGADIWLIVATPFVPPSPADRSDVARTVLELTNRARSKARRCGSVSFGAAAPLILSTGLERAAIEHSRDMAAHDRMSHTGSDGSSPAERVARNGYRWRLVGENLASGITTPEQVVSGWVSSPHHCENLMSPGFSEMAVAYAVDAASHGGIYWTQLFASPMR